MANPSIPRLEAYRDFQARLVSLNGLHNPEDPVHLELSDATAVGSRARGALVAIHSHYPATAPAWEQAAYLLRGLSGLAPFGAANERTGWDLVAGHLMQHRMPVEEEEREVDDLLAWLGDALAARYPEGFGAQNLLDRDLLFLELFDWFRHRIQAVGSGLQGRVAIGLVA
ncbi:MAG: hypothetical protein ACYDBQ_03770 [Thermoplasmatota archaeon]